MNIVEYVPWLYVGVCFGYMPISGIAGSSGRSIYKFLRNCQIDFRSVLTSFQSHQQWRSAPLSPLRKLNIVLPEDLAIPLLGIYPEDVPTGKKDTCSTMFIAPLFIIARS